MGAHGALSRNAAKRSAVPLPVPDSINHQGEPGWPDVILRPGKTYRHVMVHKFLAE